MIETVMQLSNELAAYANARRDELDALRKNGSKQPEHAANYAARQREIEAIAATCFVLAACGVCIGEEYNRPKSEAVQRALHRLVRHRVTMAFNEKVAALQAAS